MKMEFWANYGWAEMEGIPAYRPEPWFEYKLIPVLCVDPKGYNLVQVVLTCKSWSLVAITT